MIRAHKQALLDRLRSDGELADCTHEGVVIQRPERYCTIFADSGTRAVERFTGPSATATFTFTVHSVGTTPDQAQWVAEHVFAALLDYTPAVAGRVCRRLRHVTSRPTQIDSDLELPLFYNVDVFELTSDPA